MIAFMVIGQVLYISTINTFKTFMLLTSFVTEDSSFFLSNGLPKVFGAVVVTPESQVRVIIYRYILYTEQ